MVRFKCGHTRTPDNTVPSWQYQTLKDGTRKRYDASKCLTCKTAREMRWQDNQAALATRVGYGL